MFSSQEEYEQVITDFKAFNKFLSTYKQQIIQDMTMQIPAVVAKHIKDQLDCKSIMRQFGKDFKDLKDHNEQVAGVVNLLAAEHPDWDTKKILYTAGEKVREAINESNV